MEADGGEARRRSPVSEHPDGGEHLVLPRSTGAGLEAEGGSGAKDRMEDKKQFLCGVVEGKLLLDHVISFSYLGDTMFEQITV